MRKIRKGDDVIVIAGRDKGKRGTVTQVLDNKVMVEGINIVKKHTKANPSKGVAGGILEKEMPLQISNIAFFNAQTKKADRVGIKTLDDGTRVRYLKSDGEVLDS